MDRLGCMSEHWLFRHLDDAGRQQIIAAVHRRSFHAGERLFREGDAAHAVLLVTAGRVRLVTVQEDGREMVLGYLAPHDLYGEHVLFEEVRHAVSATWVEDGTICECHKADFEAMLERNPALARAVIRAQGEKLREMTERWASGAGSPVQQRIALVLAQLSRKYGEMTEQGIRLPFRLTHEEIGALVGASRVMVTNALGVMRKDGLLILDAANYFVLAPELTQRVTPDVPPLTGVCPCFSEH